VSETHFSQPIKNNLNEIVGFLQKNIPLVIECCDAIQSAVTNSCACICLIGKSWNDSGEGQYETKFAINSI
jgi:hypothetical protein